MLIKLIRIDDRLIHGQIVTTWINETEAELIIVADDKAAKDSFQKSLLKMACPSSVLLRVFTLDKAIETIKKSQTDRPTMIIVRDPQSAFKLFQGGVEMTSINVGNISEAPGRKPVMAHIKLTEEEKQIFQQLRDKDVNLDTRAVPTDKQVNLVDLF